MAYSVLNDFTGFTVAARRLRKVTTATVTPNTATNATKPATLETGVEIRVPLFINEGDLIEVDTRDGSYVTRK